VLKAFVSVWSADLLAMADSLDPIIDVVDGLHVDVTDGHLAPSLLFGPDLVAALRRRYATIPIETHLMVAEADTWSDPMAEAGASMVTIHPRGTPDLGRSLAHLAALGVRPGLALEIDDPLDLAEANVEAVDRILLMGTLIGIKGAGIDPGTYGRIEHGLEIREASRRRPHVFVDGGIRAHTVPLIDAAGADGVIPGSLVLGAPDPCAAIEALHRLPGRSSALAT
jgi:ribulose-phosphate 3-epimerase